MCAASTARSVQYQVSDSLRQRHPYNPATTFEARREDSKRNAYDGALPHGIPALVQHLTTSISDESVETEMQRKTAALQLLCNHSVSQEMKINIVKHDAVPVVCSVLSGIAVSADSPSTAGVTVNSLRLLRSIAVIPQGAVAVVEEGGIEHISRLLARTDWIFSDGSRAGDNGTAIATEAALAAGALACSLAGRSRMLSVPISDCFRLPDRPVLITEKNVYAACNTMVSGLHKALQIDGGGDRGASSTRDDELRAAAATALADLSQVAEGVHAIQRVPNYEQTLADALEFYASRYCASAQKTDTVANACNQLFTAAWNVNLVGDGIQDADLRRAMFTAGIHVLRDGCVSSIESPPWGRCDLVSFTKHFGMKRAVMGAIASLAKSTELKMASSTTSWTDAATPTADVHDTPFMILFQFIVNVQRMLDDERDAQEKGTTHLPSTVRPRVTMRDLESALKNSVHAIRLTSEVKETRNAAQSLLKELEAEHSTDAFYVRLQLYNKTRWENMFNAAT